MIHRALAEARRTARQQMPALVEQQVEADWQLCLPGATAGAFQHEDWVRWNDRARWNDRVRWNYIHLRRAGGDRGVAAGLPGAEDARHVEVQLDRVRRGDWAGRNDAEIGRASCRERV